MASEENILRLIRIQATQSMDTQAHMNKVYGNVVMGHENVVRDDDSIWYRDDEKHLSYCAESRDGVTLLTSSIECSSGHENEPMLDDFKICLNILDAVASHNHPIYTTFTIFAPEAENEDRATSYLEAYAQHLNKNKLGVGYINGCLFSILETGEDEQYTKHYFVSSTNQAAAKNLKSTIDEIKKVATQTAHLSRLNIESDTFTSALKPGETEISERTESFLWNLLEPKPVALETLESWLGYIMERDASLSAMISAIREKLVESRVSVSRIEDVFVRLNEARYQDQPSSLEGEIRAYKRIPETYENFLVRSDALKARLGTVMESVRTYLSIQQQKLSLEEQKASKEQLVRLVDLQEIFHKVEIFILAVYITEMARIVFEVIAESNALILTALFIPVALVAAVGVTRLLHGR
jgi:hypothetical protein